ncbi:hypothetical protein PPYR_11887 [Photinus pyralis]|uniref:Alanine--glyoxylate aminotransferase n=1 Tax=Photinus pyralis TaxID=7054 RepID=A0A1Y1KEJ8_PHOPY|nr:serine--pyruvate aminotransferase, mitochondrial-like [Photinus pyralis]XP_031351976.1 serine--pyruvate aminotransferase, mitochondrial-like [Photinus pyralis]XP_031351977.1 serine--pyruvate aminotransferase, mitochondrial-like [Photinus pyralis]XP_031351978.1 serine--pyruvate aminotransferase, mitochondrial-like [Photinus pyralis]KAB0795048.1 hypothetical protein PPYR_11887 [Photinus pyralis]
MHSKLDITDEFYSKKRPYSPSSKLLVGAGPCNCSPRVMYTYSHEPVIIPGDEVYNIMEEFREMLKFALQTRNQATLAIQNSGTGGLEAALTNMVDPGEKIVVGVMGFWGQRIVEIARTRNIDVVVVSPQYGQVFTLEELEQAVIKHKPVLLFVTHGESSTGAVQPLEGLGDICHKYNCMLAVDAVITFGAIPLYVDRWGIDVLVTSTQKAARSFPGLAYLSFSPEAVERIKTRKTVPPFYFNVLELSKMWNCFDERIMYYYTYNSNLLAAAKEGIAEIIEEGLLETWQKHEKLNKRLWDGLVKLGLKIYVKNLEHRLHAVTAVELPPTVSFAAFNEYLVERYQIYISVGIGPTAVTHFRIGMMGYNARADMVDYVLDKIGEALKYCQQEKLRAIKLG